MGEGGEGGREGKRIKEVGAGQRRDLFVRIGPSDNHPFKHLARKQPVWRMRNAKACAAPREMNSGGKLPCSMPLPLRFLTNRARPTVRRYEKQCHPSPSYSFLPSLLLSTV